jgi:hypothetical protein
MRPQRAAANGTTDPINGVQFPLPPLGLSLGEGRAEEEQKDVGEAAGRRSGAVVAAPPDFTKQLREPALVHKPILPAMWLKSGIFGLVHDGRSVLSTILQWGQVTTMRYGG